MQEQTLHRHTPITKESTDHQLDKIVISAPAAFPDEEQFITKMLQHPGLFRFHLRKPGWSAKQLSDLLNKIPVEWYHKLVLHREFELAQKTHAGGFHQASFQYIEKPHDFIGTWSRSCHHLDETHAQHNMDYIFLSPVFDSISKKGYTAGFDYKSLSSRLKSERKTRVFALGGIEKNNIGLCKTLGFDGVAFLGAIWQGNSAKQAWKSFQDLMENYGGK